MSDSNYIRPVIFEGVDGVRAVFSTRHGGVSQAPFASLNTGLATGDQEELVFENRRRVLEAAGFALDQLAWAAQVHGSVVKEVDRPGIYRDCDGLVTATPGVALGIGVADCAAILLADGEAGVVGACHSGWRGTAGNISGGTVTAMERLGARPERIHAYVSPCISGARFEVGQEVADQFAPQYVASAGVEGKYLVDLKAVIRDQLLEAGLREEHLEIDPACTMTDTDRYFSYRAEAGRTGRMLGVIGRQLS